MNAHATLSCARAVIAALLLGLLSPSGALAVLDGKGTDVLTAFDAVYLAPDGRCAVVGAVLSCTEGELYQLRVRLNQRSTATLASGRAHGLCTGDEQRFTVRLEVAPGHQRLEPGAVRALGLVTTRKLPDGGVTDAHQWQKDLDIE